MKAYNYCEYTACKYKDFGPSPPPLEGAAQAADVEGAGAAQAAAQVEGAGGVVKATTEEAAAQDAAVAQAAAVQAAAQEAAVAQAAAVHRRERRTELLARFDAQKRRKRDHK